MGINLKKNKIKELRVGVSAEEGSGSWGKKILFFT